MGNDLSCTSCSTADDKSLPERMSKTLSRWKDKRNPEHHMHSLQILNARSTEQTVSFVNRLQNDLAEKHNIKANKIETLTEVQPGEILVIICNRNEPGSMGKAVEKCLEGVEHDFYRRIVLVVLHVIREDKLPVLSSRDEIQAIKDYSDLGCVIDMGFQDGSIYSCKTNDTAFKQLANFYSEYSPVYNDPNADADQCTSEKVRKGKKDKINIRSKPGTSENSLSEVERQYNDSPERKTLEKVYERLEEIVKHSVGGEVKIPIKELEDITSDIKDTLCRKTDVNKCKIPYLKILDDGSSPPATSFVNALRKVLAQRHNIASLITETWDEVQSEEVLVVICNRNESESIGKAVEKFLLSVKVDLNKRIMLIILHVTRQDQLPKMSSSGEIRAHNDLNKTGCVVEMGFQDDTIYSCEMNEIAFKEISNFFLKNGLLCNDSEKQSNAEHHVSKKRRNIEQDSNNCRPTRERVRKTVYILNSSNTEASKSFIAIFQERMNTSRILLSEKQISDAKNLDSEPLVIVVCNASTRLLSDIKECLSPPIRQLCNRTILLVLHVIRKGKEPAEGTRRTLEDINYHEEYEFLHSIIDIAFTIEDGIYECSMNEKAFADFSKIYDDFLNS